MSTPTSTPVILYSASGIPIGPVGAVRALIQFYRPTAAADSAGLQNVAGVVAAGSEGTGAAAVGSPIAVSDLALELTSVTHKTTGVYGQSNNDPTVVRGDPTLNCGTFIQAAGQPMLCPGDFCNLVIGTKVTSTAGTPAYCASSRWVVGSNSLNTAGPNKWSLRLELDRTNSAATLFEF